jgi:hypothetical protein
LQAHWKRQYNDKLLKAATIHEELQKILKLRSALAPLPPDEDGLNWRSILAAAECRTDMGDYETPIASYEVMAGLYAGRVEALYAMAGIARCYFLQKKDDKGRDVLERMKRMVESLADAAFPTSPGMMSKAQWQQWVAERLPVEVRRTVP